MAKKQLTLTIAEDVLTDFKALIMYQNVEKEPFGKELTYSSVVEDLIAEYLARHKLELDEIKSVAPQTVRELAKE